MAKKSGEGNVFNNVKEVLDMLRVHEDSGEEDFAESLPKLQEKESDRENDELELEDLDTQLSSLFLQMKIYKDQVCNNKVKYLAEMVQYGTKNLSVQQDVGKKEIFSV